jgi:hypothetical protein
MAGQRHIVTRAAVMHDGVRRTIGYEQDACPGKTAILARRIGQICAFGRESRRRGGNGQRRLLVEQRRQHDIGQRATEQKPLALHTTLGANPKNLRRRNLCALPCTDDT